MKPEFFLPDHWINNNDPFLPLSQTTDWSISLLKIKEIHQTFGLKGKGIKVAIVDTGAQHSDFEHAIPNPKYRNLIKDGGWNVTEEAGFGSNGHGTGVTYLIGARDNEIGTQSVAPECTLLPIKGMRENGSGSLKEIIAAGYLAQQLGAHVVNFSLGTRSNNESFYQMVKDLTESGIVVVCAAGNTGMDNDVNFPAAWPESIACAAVNQRKETSAFSSKGQQIEIGAPGERVLTGWKNDTYATVSGTSFSSPIVAGCIALFLEAGINLTTEMLKQTSIDIDEPGFDTKSGWGLINPFDIIKTYRKNAAPSSIISPSPSASTPKPVSLEKPLIAYNALKEFLIQNGVL